MAIVTPADRPKSVRNRCVIEVFGGVLCVVTLLFGLFCRCEGFCHRAESDLFLFSFVILENKVKELCEIHTLLPKIRTSLTHIALVKAIIDIVAVAPSSNCMLTICNT